MALKSWRVLACGWALAVPFVWFALPHMGWGSTETPSRNCASGFVFDGGSLPVLPEVSFSVIDGGSSSSPPEEPPLPPDLFFVIYAHPYMETCGGCGVLHLLAHKLNTVFSREVRPALAYVQFWEKTSHVFHPGYATPVLPAWMNASR